MPRGGDPLGPPRELGADGRLAAGQHHHRVAQRPRAIDLAVDLGGRRVDVADVERVAEGAVVVAAVADLDQRLHRRRLGVDRRPAHALVETCAIGDTLALEEVLERHVEEVEEAGVVDDARVILVREAHLDRGPERHESTLARARAAGMQAPRAPSAMEASELTAHRHQGAARVEDLTILLKVAVDQRACAEDGADPAR
jgi:hypothetical protein